MLTFVEAAMMNFTVMPRRWWQAAPPRLLDPSVRPANIVYLTQTGANTGYSTSFCIQELRRVQQRQMERGGIDITYNFMVGANGEVFEGRGWYASPKMRAMHKRIAKRCISVGFIGDFRHSLPSDVMLDSVHNLIRLGVERGLITPNFLEYSTSFWTAPCVDSSNEVLANVLSTLK